MRLPGWQLGRESEIGRQQPEHRLNAGGPRDHVTASGAVFKRHSNRRREPGPRGDHSITTRIALQRGLFFATLTPSRGSRRPVDPFHVKGNVQSGR